MKLEFKHIANIQFVIIFAITFDITFCNASLWHCRAGVIAFAFAFAIAVAIAASFDPFIINILCVFLT
jgi:hypothetical protein